MKAALLLSLLTLTSQASILKRPDYVPDENHTAPEKAMVSKQAEEERPRESRDVWKDQKEMRKKEAKQGKKIKLK